jgi:hypothetical protein
VLANGGDDLPVPVAPPALPSASRSTTAPTYNITVKTQPAHMTCSVSAGSASAGHNVSIQAW